MIGYIILGIGIGTIIGYLFMQAKSGQMKAEIARIPDLEGQIKTGHSDNSKLLVQLTETKTILNQELEKSKQYLAFIENAEDRFSDMFGKLSKEALSENSQIFLRAAKTDFETRTNSIERTLQPVKENLEKLEQFNRDLESKRVGAYSSLETHIKI